MKLIGGMKKLGKSEVFNFDNQNRLLNGQVTAPVNLQQYFLNYNSNGTIAEKTDAGVYSEYDPLHPDAVRKIESLAGNISHLPQELDFNPFNKLSWITEGNYILNINYGPDQQRRKTELSTILNGSIQTTKYFLSNYEKIIDNGDVYEINYVTAPSGLCAMYVTTNGTGKMYYVYSDHLGSILKVTDHNATTYEQNFDAWGRYRNPDTWEYTGIPVNPVWLHRGFTSHEHLQEFVLINMNGRLYDPVVGAMLSPDNYVSDASSVIAFNRYSYCLNNPLKYTDPTGEIVWVPIIIGAAVGGFAGWQIGHAAGATGWQMAGYIAAGAGIGAITCGVGAGVSATGGGAIASRMAAGAVGGAGFSGLATNWNGNAMVQGAFYGAISGGVGAGVGAAIGGGLGAFASGTVGSGINTALYGGSLEDVGISALAGGAMAFGIYHASSYLSWHFEGGNKWGDMDISYRQYIAMQADFQRSRFWGREYGGYLLEGGGVTRVAPGSNSRIDMGTAPDGAFAEYHTHWDKPGQVRYVLRGGNGNYVDPQQVAQNTPVGQRVALDRITTSQYHGTWDLNTGGRPSLVINRYDASFYPGYGSYSPINPPINRFIYSFYPWR